MIFLNIKIYLSLWTKTIVTLFVQEFIVDWSQDLSKDLEIIEIRMCCLENINKISNDLGVFPDLMFCKD